MTVRVCAGLSALVLAVLLAGCGVRGGLDSPPSAAAEPTADAQQGQGKPENSTSKPHKPFILDGLLR